MVWNAAMSKGLGLLLILVVLGFLRAEQGVAELQGRQGEPSRVFRLAPEEDGRWGFALLGWEGRVPGEVRIYDRGRPLLASSDLSLLADFVGQVQAGLAEQLEQIKMALP